MQRAEVNETSCPERMRRVSGAVPRILLVRRRRSCSCRRASLRRPTAEFAPAALPFPEGSCGAQGCALPRAVPGQWPVHAGVQRAGPLSSIQENSEGPPRLLSSRCKWLRLPAAPQHDVGPVQLARSPAASRERSLPDGLRACTSRRLGFCFPGNPARDRSLTVQVGWWPNKCGCHDDAGNDSQCASPLSCWV